MSQKNKSFVTNKVFIKTRIKINTFMIKFLTIIQEISLPNKYTDWYMQIISSKADHINTGYTEKHHIVPKSFAKDLNIKDINNKENLVSLTAREHFICHRLLTKMFSGKFKRKMSYAMHRLTYSNNEYISSRHYELFRKQHSLNLTGEGNPMFGKIHSNETKEKMSDKAKKRIVSETTKEKMSESHKGKNNAMYGKTHTDEARKRISDGNKGIGAGENNNFYGKTHSDQTKQRLAEARRGQPKLKCHCGKEVDPSNFKRWHGNNCKKFISSLLFQ